MAYLRNDAVNRVNLHYGIQALAQGVGGIFFLAFLLSAGVSTASALVAQAAILAGRFALRPALLPLARRWGLKPLLIAGTLSVALHYPLLATVRGIGTPLFLLVIVTALGEIFYWPTYHAYFAAIGDAEHRGHQTGAREALTAVVGIVAPLIGAWSLLTLGPGLAFAATGLIQATAAIPLIGAPNVAVSRHAPVAFSAARRGIALMVIDGWFDGYVIIVWQIALFVSLGHSIAAYGGAMALAGLVGAACGLWLGRHIDAGHGRRAALLAGVAATVLVVLRAISLAEPWSAVTANALGALLWPILIPVTATALYNMAKSSPCPFRFQIAAEAGWDVGCMTACLVAAALFSASVPLGLTLLLALPGMAAGVAILRRYYAR